jgi:hypothetical protein
MEARAAVSRGAFGRFGPDRKPQMTSAPWPQHTTAVQETLKLLGNQTAIGDREPIGSRAILLSPPTGAQTI